MESCNDTDNRLLLFKNVFIDVFMYLLFLWLHCVAMETVHYVYFDDTVGSKLSVSMSSNSGGQFCYSRGDGQSEYFT